MKGEVLHNHINAEIAGGTIASEKDVIEYLTWTYMFRRLLQNPTFYGLQDSKDETIEKFLLESNGTDWRKRSGPSTKQTSKMLME